MGPGVSKIEIVASKNVKIASFQELEQGPQHIGIMHIIIF